LEQREKYRIRVGDYRVIYGMENQELVILVIRIGHRKEIYR
jgi:mRNA interferase RelE/StbE